MKDDAISAIMRAFEEDDGCGHDLGSSGIVAIIRCWEEMRTPELLEELMQEDD